MRNRTLLKSIAMSAPGFYTEQEMEIFSNAANDCSGQHFPGGFPEKGGAPAETTQPTEPEPTEPEPPTDDSEKKGGNAGMIVLVLVILAGGGGAAFYFLVLKPKQGEKVPSEAP